MQPLVTEALAFWMKLGTKARRAWLDHMHFLRRGWTYSRIHQYMANRPDDYGLNYRQLQVMEFHVRKERRGVAQAARNAEFGFRFGVQRSRAYNMRRAGVAAAALGTDAIAPHFYRSVAQSTLGFAEYRIRVRYRDPLTNELREREIFAPLRPDSSNEEVRNRVGYAMQQVMGEGYRVGQDNEWMRIIGDSSTTITWDPI